MTIDERFEQQNQRIQRTNKRLTIALTMMAITICAVVTTAATGEKRGHFDTVKARRVGVTNDAGEVVVALSADEAGDGLVNTYSAKGKDLVRLSSSENGGLVYVKNKTGEKIAEMYADDYGNGVVAAYNRKGKSETLKPGP